MIEGMAEEIVVAADARDVVTNVNVWFLEKVGLKRKEVVGKSLWDFHPDNDGTARLRAAMAEFRSDGPAPECTSPVENCWGCTCRCGHNPSSTATSIGGPFSTPSTSAIWLSPPGRRGGHQRQEPVSCQHEPRDSHSDDRYSRLHGYTSLRSWRRPRALEAAQIIKRNRAHLCNRSTTFSTFPRSRRT